MNTLKSDFENYGFLVRKKGGHRTSLRKRFRRLDADTTAMEILDTTPLATDDMVPVEVEKGSCIVLDGLLPHYSLPNSSGTSARVMRTRR